MTEYNHKEIEKRWQDFWAENQTFRASMERAKAEGKPKYYALDMFPYPSGAGLHVGHPVGYTATDIVSRKKRHEGYEVLHPMGWDAFGLPAENYAIKTGVHPRTSTDKNIETFRGQLQALGFSYDWERELATTDEDYFKWTQWLFIQMYKKGLLYEHERPMNWCPKCKIVAANEEVEAGKHERCGEMVERKNLKQWMFKITQYADRLIEDLDELPEWPEKVKLMQKNWIGKKTGINIEYEIDGLSEKVTCFTTRPDTNFGATFVVLAPEHEILQKHLDSLPNKVEVEKYIKESQAKSDIERMAEGRKKTGAFTGLYVINNLNGKKLPLYVGDFVLAHVGTGAVVGVPGHDLRDFEFAQAFGIDIVRVVVAPDGDTSDITRPEQVQESAGTMINSDFLDGLDIHEATQKVMDYLEEKGWGKRVVSYKLRDWIFTRQRFWGEPIPLVHCEKCGIVPVAEKDLPLRLPETPNYEPSASGESPLAKIDDWVNTECPKCGGAGKRETSTMPNWAGSNWYYLRYMDNNNEQEFCSKEAEEFWGPVDLYVGGAEHAVLHLLYSRFWHKVLFDLGLVSTKEPFKKLVNTGLIMAEDGVKMSKSLGNVVNPDEMIEKFGADSLRVYEMFMGPFEQSKAWNEKTLSGTRKFLDRVWRVFEKPVTDKENKDLLPVLHKTIKVVSEHIDDFKFNTAIAQMMVLVNELTALKEVPRNVLEDFAVLLAPFAPHLAEEFWKNLGHKGTIAFVAWPKYDESLLVEDSVKYAVQVNGKLRADFEISKDALKEEAIAMAKSLDSVQKWIDGKEIVKEIFVPGKIVGFVVRD